MNKSFGLKGHLRIFMEPEILSRLKKLKVIFLLQKNKPLPYFTDEVSFEETGHGIVHFEEVNNKTTSDQLVGKEIFVDQKALRKAKPKYSYGELIGFELNDEKNGFLGKLEDVLQLPGHETGQFLLRGKEILFPLNHETILQIDREKKIVSVRIPDGLLEVYLGPTGTES